MPPEDTDWDQLAQRLESGDGEAVTDFLGELSVEDQRRVFSRLSWEDQVGVVELVEPSAAAEVIEHLPESQASDILQALEPETAASIIEQLPEETGATVLRNLGERESAAVLELFQDASDGESLRQIISYEPETAGALMNPHFAAFPREMKVGELLDHLGKESTELTEAEVQYIYTLNEDGSLAGVLPLRNLVIARRSRELSSLMIGEPLYVAATDSLESLEARFKERNFLGLPVVDPDTGVLRGVVSRNAVAEARARHNVSDFQQSRGIIGGEELRSMPMLSRCVRRLSWLAPNILLNLAAASIIALYEDTIQQVIALAVFLPIVSDMSGCSGNQAVAVSMRELTLGVIRPTEFLRVVWKEGILGIINGIILGCLLGTIAAIWKSNLFLGLVIGSALALNTVVSVLLGGVVPLMLKRFKVDPALASGPILTTCTDMCGFFLVLNLAAMAMARLVE